MNKNLVIALLAIISVGSVGYIAYDKISNNDISNEIASDYKLEDFTETIDKELNFLKSKEKLTDLTNEEKTYMIYKLSNIHENLTVSKFEDVRKNSSLREMEVEYTDILDSVDGYNLLQDSKYQRNYILDKETGKYTSTDNGHGAIGIGAIPFLVDFKQTDNKYILSYKYVFRMNTGDGPTDINIYYTFEDASNGKNIAKEFLLKNTNWDYTLLNNQVNMYIQENYESFKDKLDTYNYLFEIHDGNIVLTDFYRD